MTVWIAFAAGVFVGWVIEWIIDWLYWRRNLAGFYTTETQLRNELAAAQARLNELSVENEALRAQLASAPERALVASLADDGEEIDSETETAETGGVVPDGERVDDGVVAAGMIETGDADKDEEFAAESDDTSVDAFEAITAEGIEAVEGLIAGPAPETGDESAAPVLAPALDDLTRINGIGPVYRRKLHEAGVKTFAQLATLTLVELTAIIQPADYQKPAFGRWIADAGLLAVQAAGDDASGVSADEEA